MERGNDPGESMVDGVAVGGVSRFIRRRSHEKKGEKRKEQMRLKFGSTN